MQSLKSHYGQLISLCCLCAGSLWACDDDSSSANETLQARFIFPSDNLGVISCAHDTNRTTKEIEIDVSAVVYGSPETDFSKYSAKLVLETDEAANDLSEQEKSYDGKLSFAGRVDFSNVKLSQQTKSLLFQVIENGVAVAQTRRPLRILWDARACALDPVLSFVEPDELTVFTEKDDLDHDLTNGLQINAAVAAEHAAEVSAQIELSVDGELLQREHFVDGIATFTAVTIPLVYGPHELKAATALNDDGYYGTVSRTIRVEPNPCTVDIAFEDSPCLTADFDEDPNEPGLQKTFEVSSDCPEITWYSNGRAVDTTAIGENGKSRLSITLQNGLNTVFAAASDGSSTAARTGQSETLTVFAQSEFPSITFENESEDSQTVTLDASSLKDGVFEVLGVVSNMNDSAQIRVNMSPEIEFSAPETLSAAGRLALQIPAQTYCGELDLELTESVDAIENCAKSVTLHRKIVLDGTTPKISLETPSPVFPRDDVDENAEGLQVALTVNVDDPRGNAVDYAIDVLCSPITTPDLQTSRLAAPLHFRDAVDGKLSATITLNASDHGFVTCKPVISDFVANGCALNNDAIVSAATIEVLYKTPGFAVQEPTPDFCTNGPLYVSGFGQNLGSFGTQINASVNGQTHALSDLGQNRYGAALDLEDGLYTVEITGESSTMPIGANPASITARVDKKSPTIALISPTSTTITEVQDIDGNPNNGVQVELSFNLIDESATSLCYTVNGSAETCAQAVNGIAKTATLDLVTGENKLTIQSVDCAGNKAQVRPVFTVESETPRLLITAPQNGATLSEKDDANPTADGFQIAVSIETNLHVGSTVSLVRLTNDQPVEQIDNIAVDENGRATTTFTINASEFANRALNISFQIKHENAVSPFAYATLTTNPPTIALNAPESACLSDQFSDLSIADGYQAQFTAVTSGLTSVTSATLQANCGTAPERIVQGSVQESGEIVFSPITLIENTTCRLTTTAIDDENRIATDSRLITTPNSRPTIQIVSPASSTLTRLDDSDLNLEGLQVAFTAKVCGAPKQTLALNIAGQAHELRTGSDTCSEVGPVVVTVQEDFDLTAQIANTCGNQSEFAAHYTFDDRAAIQMAEMPQVVNSAMDLDSNTAGCQIQTSAHLLGFSNNATFEVCYQIAQGEAICETTTALGCTQTGTELNCPLSIAQPANISVFVTGEEAGVRTISSPVLFFADCESPKLTELKLLQDTNGDGCLNRAERSNANDFGDVANFSLQAKLEGLEDGRLVSFYQVLNNATTWLGAWPVMSGVVTSSLRSVEQGNVIFYATAEDANHNPLSNGGENGLTVAARVDTTVTAPVLKKLNENTCLNASADESDTTGLQYTFELESAAPDEQFTLIVDGRTIETLNGGQTTFQTVSLSEGAHQVAVTAQDSCGNVASLAGFEATSPKSLAFSVDTIPPVLEITGVNPGKILQVEDDADHITKNGFQYDLGVAVQSGLEPGQIITVSTNGELSKTLSHTGATNYNLRVTLNDAENAVVAHTQDTCGNQVEKTVSIKAEVFDCVSFIQSIGDSTFTRTTSPLKLGSSNGTVQNGLLIADIQGQSYPFQSECFGLPVELEYVSRDYTQKVFGTIEEDGAIYFDQMSLPEGEGTLQITVLDDLFTTRIPVSIDITAPSVTITSPETFSIVQTDSNESKPGQQLVVTAIIEEPSILSERTVTLSQNGTVLQTQAIANNQTVNLTFDEITLVSGVNTLRVCAKDAQQNQSCSSVSVNADAAAPNAPSALSTTIDNPRKAQVSLNFAASSDDGDGAEKVSHYEVYVSTEAFTEETLETATPYVTAEAIAEPGSQESIVISPLTTNSQYYLAIRAFDEVGRSSAMAQTQVDLSLASQVFSIKSNALDGAWLEGDWSRGEVALFGGDSVIDGAGDFNGDGLQDVLVYANQMDLDYNDVGQAAVILGNNNPANAEVLYLNIPADQYYPAIIGTWAGDLNGDGATDIAILGYSDTNVISLYFGCQGPCDTNALIEPDVQITVDPMEFTASLQAAGNFNQRTEDAGKVYDDLLLGSLLDGSALVIAGRRDWPSELDLTTTNSGLSVLSAGNAGDYQLAGFAEIAGDLNNDGYTDILVSADQFDSQAGYYLSHFQTGFIFYGGQDLTNVAYSADATPYVAGTAIKLETPPEDCATEFNYMAMSYAADINGNSVPGIIVGSYIAKRAVLYDAEGAAIACLAGNADFGHFVDFVGDFNDDGFIDLMSSAETDSQSGVYAGNIYFNNGTGNFGTPTALDVRRRIADLTLSQSAMMLQGIAGVGDFNGDGYVDVATAHFDGDQLIVTIHY